PLQVCTVTIGGWTQSIPSFSLSNVSLDRRRRRTESFKERRQTSRAPSGTLRQPIKRSAAPRNPRPIGRAFQQK
ncbi:unnamed protein product, partial [Allacma fusca]